MSVVKQDIDSYFYTLGSLLTRTAVTDRSGSGLSLDTAFATVIDRLREGHEAGNKLVFAGNGGSAAIASHMAIDYSKNGRIRSMALNDPAALTCLGNDFGYEHVFSKQIEFHGRSGDTLVAISSSGQSPNMLNAMEAARACGMVGVTLTGFSAANPLRRMGDVNFYVASDLYGFVEIGHLALCHAILDLACGWRVDIAANA